MKATRASGIVIVLQGRSLARPWVGAPSVQPAQAQPIANPERDRTVMIEELRSMNSKLDRLVGILEGGKLQVQVSSPDDNKAGRPAR